MSVPTGRDSTINFIISTLEKDMNYQKLTDEQKQKVYLIVDEELPKGNLVSLMMRPWKFKKVAGRISDRIKKEVKGEK